MPFRHAGDQIRGSRKDQRRGKAAHRRDDITIQPKQSQGLIDRPLIEAAPGNVDVAAAGKARGRNLTFAKLMPKAYDTDKPIPEQSLPPHLRSRRLSDDPGLQINRPISKRCALLVGLGHKPQPHAGRLRLDTSNEVRAKILHKSFAGPQRERSNQQR